MTIPSDIKDRTADDLKAASSEILSRMARVDSDCSRRSPETGTGGSYRARRG